MEELAPFEVAFPRIVSEHEPVEPLQVGLPVHGSPGEVLRRRRDLLLDPAAAVFRIGMRGEPLRDAAAALRLAHPREHLEHVRHLARVVTPAAQIAQPELVRLALVVA